MFISKKWRSCLVFSFITTCAVAATCLLVLCLVLDMWRSQCDQLSDTTATVTFADDNTVNKKTEFVQGIFHECSRTHGPSMNCFPWTKSISKHKLLQLRELIFALVIGAVGCGGFSLMVSLAIVVVKLPKAKYSALVTGADLASILLGMTVAGVYDVIFLNDQWIPAASYYCLLGSTLCTFITLSLRLFIQSLKTNEIRAHTETYLKYYKDNTNSYTI